MLRLHYRGSVVLPGGPCGALFTRGRWAIVKPVPLQSPQLSSSQGTRLNDGALTLSPLRQQDTQRCSGHWDNRIRLKDGRIVWLL